MSKIKTKTVSQLKNKLQKLVNKQVRLRDTDINGNGQCISCGKFISFAEMQAGHYYSVGAYPAVRFDLFNINGQCASCNTWKSGNLAEYRLGLIDKYGKTSIVDLDKRRKAKTLTGIALKSWLQSQIEIHEAMIKTMLEDKIEN